MKRFFSCVLTTVLTTLISAGPALAEPSKPPISEDEMVGKFLEANQHQQTALRGATMEVDIDASVPKLKKQGKLHALKNISKLGKITYHALSFIGENMVKTEVIARYLTAEVQATQDGAKTDIAITPENYKFKYKGTEALYGREVYVMHVTPKHKKVGLFKGELWLDAETGMPVRESGSFVKSPSIFLKKMQFVQMFEMQNGVSIPQRLESKVEVRFFGPVELNVNYLKFSKEDPDSVTASTDQQ
ncbi:MAG TPA: hypothetical protein VIX89_08140 [Bryobacteraceae bacterium]